MRVNQFDLRDPTPQEWMARAACTGMDPELFFPGRGDDATVKAAKRVCRGCPVRLRCLEYALDNHEKFGVWGGTSERERRRIRLERRRRAAA